MSGLRDLVMGGSGGGGCDDGRGGASSSSSATEHRNHSSFASNPLGAFADFLLRRGDGGGIVSNVPTPQHPIALAQKQQNYARAAAAEMMAMASTTSPSLAVPGVAADPALPPPWAAEFHPHHQYHAPPAAPSSSWAGEFTAAPPPAASFPEQHQEQRRFVAPVPPPPPQSHFHHHHHQRAWAEDFSAFQQHVQHRNQQQQQQQRREGSRAVAPLPTAAAAVAAAPTSAPPSLHSRGPTPAERRAARGPHPDDPHEVEELEVDEGGDFDDLSSFGGSAVSLTSSTSSSVDSLSASRWSTRSRGGRGLRRQQPPTWVRQFNESLAEALVRGTTNSAPALELEAEAVGALASAERNPFLRVRQATTSSSSSSFHELLATARAAAERGLPGAAALALEACVRQEPLSARSWHALGLARADLGDGPGAARALSRATKLMEREMKQARERTIFPSSAERDEDALNDNSPSSQDSKSSSSSYSRALLDLALACFASGAASGASKVRAEGVEALCKWCCETAEEAAAAAVANSAANAPPLPLPPPPGAVSVSALDEHLRARAAALSGASSSSSDAPSNPCPASSARCTRDAWMALGVLRGLRAASGGSIKSYAEAVSSGNGSGSNGDATAAADAFAAAAAASLLVVVAGGGGGGSGEDIGAATTTPGDDSQALACLGRALLSAGRPAHAVAALERATGNSNGNSADAPASAWMLLGTARGVVLEEAKKKNSSDESDSASSAIHPPLRLPPHPLSAAAAFARAAQVAPDASPPWESLAVALTAAGREDLAAAADARRRELPNELLRLAQVPVADP